MAARRTVPVRRRRNLRHRSRARIFPFPPKHATHGLTGPVEHFQFETLRVPNPAGWHFAEKTRPSRLAWAGRRCVATSRFPLFKGKTLSPCTDKTKGRSHGSALSSSDTLLFPAADRRAGKRYVTRSSCGRAASSPRRTCRTWRRLLHSCALRDACRAVRDQGRRRASCPSPASCGLRS